MKYAVAIMELLLLLVLVDVVVDASYPPKFPHRQQGASLWPMRSPSHRKN